MVDKFTQLPETVDDIMKLQETLTADCTFSAVKLSSKKRILERICAIAVNKVPDLDQKQLLKSILEREKMGSTGIGNGIAIPHGRLTNTKKVIAIVLTSEAPIPFDAIDNRAVDIFVALFVPENSCDEHLQTLQSIAQLFSDKIFCKRIRKCLTDDELFQLIQQAD
jgi:PTS system nitrogen regulatory IIA component